jgi:hypothetical protein
VKASKKFMWEDIIFLQTVGGEDRETRPQKMMGWVKITGMRLPIMLTYGAVDAASKAYRAKMGVDAPKINTSG